MVAAVVVKNLHLKKFNPIFGLKKKIERKKREKRKKKEDLSSNCHRPSYRKIRFGTVVPNLLLFTVVESQICVFKESRSSKSRSVAVA